MDFKDIVDRAKQIRKKYAQLEKQQYGHVWSKTEILQGFLGDVEHLKGILSKKTVARDKLAHELADCLWSLIILAGKNNIDLEKSFLSTMEELDIRIDKQTKESRL